MESPTLAVRRDRYDLEALRQKKPNGFKPTRFDRGGCRRCDIHRTHFARPVRVRCLGLHHALPLSRPVTALVMRLWDNAVQPLSGLMTPLRGDPGWDRCPSAQRRSDPGLDYTIPSGLVVLNAGKFTIRA